ncbi:MAG: hypothetical protein AVDCRST_MAG11-2040 [uncultured Gemmatimonadaceae bacterium]|uniref:PspA/IM30 family protein n=1 Tax=uncultured Gemmatimonadaceae bacterium TaxID=246130 RepID=A0A6J4L1Z8_9BACT|nr:MAG: hypothetical protein AVDCRST_MAG11-2040 [uncultured Gemmatimonadaceae bacterium]
MFETLRQTLRDALQRATRPQDRREVLAEMKATLVQARVGVADLRAGADRTRARLGAERTELDTVRRRRELAQRIDDRETVAVAERFERQHAERVELLARKLEVEARDLALAEAEVAEMVAEFKSAAAGAPIPGAPVPHAAAGEPLGDPLADALDALDRSRTRAEREAAADDQLAALKRRMGR